MAWKVTDFGLSKDKELTSYKETGERGFSVTPCEIHTCIHGRVRCILQQRYARRRADDWLRLGALDGPGDAAG